MTDISTWQSEASPPEACLGGDDHSVVVTDPHAAWTLLDEASEDLVRAEAIVELLGLEMEASTHQFYAAQIAGDFLRTASARVSEARDQVRDIDLASRGR